MDLQNRNYIIGGIVVLAVVIVVAWSFFDRGEDEQNNEPTGPQGREGEAIDVVSDFYSKWLSAVRSTSTDPYQSGLATDQVLSQELRDRLESVRDAAPEDRDPILCQSALLDRIRTKAVFEDETRAQYMILPSGEGTSGHAVVSLRAVEDRWLITDVTCTVGESAPEREFDFEKEGNLLKSVPPPLDPQYWHLVFEENGQMGHTAPLFFDEQSVCIAFEGGESVCDPDQFIQTKEVRVQGSMSESGVTVKRLEFLE